MEAGGGVMTVQLPPLKDLTGAFEEFVQRLADPSPAYAATKARYNKTKHTDFKTGTTGWAGAQPTLAASTRKRHRTGVPLWNTKALGRSFYDPSSAHYHWLQDAQGWAHTSTAPALDKVHRYLLKRGYKDPVGLSDLQWDYIDHPVLHYVDTGEVVTHA